MSLNPYRFFLSAVFVSLAFFYISSPVFAVDTAVWGITACTGYSSCVLPVSLGVNEEVNDTTPISRVIINPYYGFSTASITSIELLHSGVVLATAYKSSSSWTVEPDTFSSRSFFFSGSGVTPHSIDSIRINSSVRLWGNIETRIYVGQYSAPVLNSSSVTSSLSRFGSDSISTIKTVLPFAFAFLLAIPIILLALRFFKRVAFYFTKLI